MASEATLGDYVTSAADVFSFGILMEELLSGYEAQRDVMERLQSGPLHLEAAVQGRTMQLCGHTAGTLLIWLFQNCTHVDPACRPDMHWVVEALKYCAAHLPWVSRPYGMSRVDEGACLTQLCTGSPRQGCWLLHCSTWPPGPDVVDWAWLDAGDAFEALESQTSQTHSYNSASEPLLLSCVAGYRVVSGELQSSYAWIVAHLVCPIDQMGLSAACCCCKLVGSWYLMP